MPKTQLKMFKEKTQYVGKTLTLVYQVICDCDYCTEKIKGRKSFNRCANCGVSTRASGFNLGRKYFCYQADGAFCWSCMQKYHETKVGTVPPWYSYYQEAVLEQVEVTKEIKEENKKESERKDRKDTLSWLTIIAVGLVLIVVIGSILGFLLKLIVADI